jgi:beta-barrel assembly-enhancing protease
MGAVYQAWLIEGKPGRRRSVTIEVVGRTFLVIEQEQRHGPFEFDQLYFAGNDRRASTYGYTGKSSDWRLALSGDVPAEIASRLPVRKTMAWHIGNILFCFIFGFLLAFIAVAIFKPAWLAKLVPQNMERSIGKEISKDFAAHYCRSPAGSAALKQLEDVLNKNNPATPVSIHVANNGRIDAIAAPGDHIILMNGIIQNTRSPDELSAVILHQYMHLNYSHAMPAMLSGSGVWFLFSRWFDGGYAVRSALLSAGHNADQEAAVNAAVFKLSPSSQAALKAMRMRLQQVSGGSDMAHMVSYLSHHPAAPAPKANTNQKPTNRNIFPVSNAQWQDIKAMCAQDKKALNEATFSAP